jgi:hypothetical protein
MILRLRLAQVFLTTDGAVLLVYGMISLLFVPGSAHEPYLSSGRMLYGVLPAVLGLSSVACAIWLGSVRPQEAAPTNSE